MCFRKTQNVITGVIISVTHVVMIWHKSTCRMRKVYTHKTHTLWASALLSCLHLAKACANCSFGAICDIQTEQCVCVSECVESYQPVCGSDGITYNSECELNVRGCEKKMDLRVVSQGECSKWRMRAHVTLCTSAVLKADGRRGAEKHPWQTQTIDRRTKRKKVKSSFLFFFLSSSKLNVNMEIQVEPRRKLIKLQASSSVQTLTNLKLIHSDGGLQWKYRYFCFKRGLIAPVSDVHFN